MVAPLAKDIVVYTNGDADVTEKMLKATEGKRVTVEARRIVSLERKQPDQPEIVVRFEDGGMREEAFMVRTSGSVSDPSAPPDLDERLTSSEPGRSTTDQTQRTLRRTTRPERR